MTIQALISTMDQTDFHLLDKMCLESDAIVVNQCSRESIEVLAYRGFTVVWINSTERGLSNSRNLAIRHASADVCLLCDEDEILAKGYAGLIEQAYAELPDADLMVFNVNMIGRRETGAGIRQIKRAPKHKLYSSVHISFKRARIAEKGIAFDARFGTGSAYFAHAEDALFCVMCRRRGLKMFLYPGLIADVHCDSSSWFSGYDEKYFYDTGAFLAAAYPGLKHILKWYYVYRLRKRDTIAWREMIRNIDAGFRGYKRGLSYTQYRELRH